VSIRFPPAKGFWGSAVWQLAQSPASASALPWAMISADGEAARAAPTANALHKNKQKNIPVRIAASVDVFHGAHSPLAAL
jgi:hypothetical protein